LGFDEDAESVKPGERVKQFAMSNGRVLGMGTFR